MEGRIQIEHTEKFNMENKNKFDDSENSDSASNDGSSSESSSDTSKHPKDDTHQTFRNNNNCRISSIDSKRKIEKGSSYTYDYVTGVHLYTTSNLKFKSCIRRPKIKVSWYDIQTRTFVRKSESKRNVIFHHEPPNLDYILPIISKNGKLISSHKLSFSFNETLTINEDIEYLKSENFVIFFELIELIAYTTKTNHKLADSDGWYYICWAFLKPSNYIQKRITLQFYKYSKKKHSLKYSVIEEWLKDNKIKYPATLDIMIQYFKKSTEEKMLYSTERILQKDIQGNISEKSSLNDTIRVHTLMQAQSNEEYNLDTLLCKNKNQFSQQIFKCPSEIQAWKRLSRKCTLCRFTIDGELIAYTEISRNFTNIIVANVSDFKQLYMLTAHTGVIHSLIWMAPNNLKTSQQKLLMSTSEDHTCIIWFLKDGKYSLMVLPHTSYVYAAEFLVVANNTFAVASGGRDTLLHIWKINNEENSVHLEQQISKHESYIIGIGFNSNNSTIYSAERHGVVLEWMSDTHTTHWQSKRKFYFKQGIKCIQILTRMNTIYVATDFALFRIDIPTGLQRELFFEGQPLKTLHKNEFQFVVSNCGNYIFLSMENCTVCWNLRSEQLLKNVTAKGTSKIIDFCQEKNLLALCLPNKNGEGDCLYIYSPEAKNSNNTRKLYTLSTEYLISDSEAKLLNQLNEDTPSRFLFNEILEKCDSIIRYGLDSTTGKFTEENNLKSEKSNGTFVINNKKDFGSTYNIEQEEDYPSNKTFIMNRNDDSTDITDSLE